MVVTGFADLYNAFCILVGPSICRTGFPRLGALISSGGGVGTAFRGIATCTISPRPPVSVVIIRLLCGLGMTPRTKLRHFMGRAQARWHGKVESMDVMIKNFPSNPVTWTESSSATKISSLLFSSGAGIFV